MSETQTSTSAPATEPVMTSANEATMDPVRTNATKDLTPESRPEVTEGTSALPADTNVPKGMAAVESQPINEGVLAYKQPGLVKSLMYSKKFFWFSDEPVEHKHLTGYLRGEKATDIARPNAAHASQTGKGLLFFAKRAEDKPQPQGIINLADIKDVTKTGPTEFSFKYHGHKHAFQAVNATERDGWLVALETRHTEAKTDRDGVTGSEGYKSSLDKFSKPDAFAAGGSTSRSLSRHKKTQDTKPVEGIHGPVTSGVGGDSASSSDEAKASNAKSRSQSRKRGSMFGALLGKKEQHEDKKELKKEDKEEKKEEKAEEKAIRADVKKEEKAEKQAEKEERKEEQLLVKEEKKAPKSDGVVEPKPLDAAAVAARVMGNPVIPVEGSNVESTKTEEPLAAATTTEPSATTTEPSGMSTTPRETAPRANKRNSIFGNFFGKKETPAATSPSATMPANETAPIVPAKDTEPAPISHVAPQPEVSATETAPTLDTNAPAATTETAPATTPTTSPVSPDTAKANRRSSFFSNLGTKKEKRTGGVSDAEGTDGEGKKSGGFGGLLRKASRAQGPKSASKPMATTNGAADSEAPAPINKDATTNETTGTTSGDVVPESTPITSQQTPVQAAA
ncbi:MAG: hypothetical protein L6R38_001008 [Xanthoria sp. 2 TBL-2021]|nr:MAG: hypothetical protein L6R38_001008 [Xanthoria sp. 2 TBL-2021]